MSERDRWNTRYSVADFVFGESPNAFLAAQRHRLPKAGRVLAIADGEGRNGVWLAEQGLDVVSVDFAPAGIAKSKALAARRNVSLTWIEADITTWTWPLEAFDVVVDIFTQFLGPADRTQKFARMREALKPGGLLLLEGYTPKQLEHGTGGPKQIENLYTRAILEQAFGDMASVTIRDYETHMEEGAGHSGMAAVIDLVATK